MNSGPSPNTANCCSPIDRLSRIFRKLIFTGRRALLLPFLFLSSLVLHADGDATICLSEAEQQLVKEMNAYRKSLGLPEIPVSAKLCKVAQVHMNDLVLYSPHSGVCNLHSWSANGPWTACCYTSDHARASCMWQKPREIANYNGDGFEISYSGSAGDYIASNALEAWKNSEGHHNVMINRNEWKAMDWKAVGVGIRNGYACIWFGIVADTDPVPAPCRP